MESWLSEEINNAKVFRDDYLTFRGIGVFKVVEYSLVSEIISIAGSYELDFEMMTVEGKDRNSKSPGK